MTTPTSSAFSRRRFIQAGAGSVLLSAVMPQLAFGQASGEITVWGWSNVWEPALAAYKAANPGVSVNFVQSQGPDHYLKVRNALRAGSGIPDVIQADYWAVPSLGIVGGLADLDQYGLGDLEGNFIPWTWQQASLSGQLLALPWDIGPIDLLYRDDVFTEFSLTVPTTWAEFAEQGAKLREQTQDRYFGAFITNQAAWITGLLWQAGARHYAVDGTNIKVTINDEPTKKVLAFWQDLIDRQIVEAVPASTPEWHAAVDAGRYATYPSAAWASSGMTRRAKEGMGKWRAAAIPQWDAATPASANIGGSIMAVPAGSPNPQGGADFLRFMMTDPTMLQTYVDNNLMPSVAAVLDTPEYTDAGVELFDGQKARPIFKESSALVDPSFQWSPFQDYADQILTEELAKGAAGQGTLVEAIDRVQEQIVAFASEQGFTITS